MNEGALSLYSLTLERSNQIQCGCHGNFSGTKVQEIVVSHGKSLELLRPDTAIGRVQSLLTWEVFGCIRSVCPFRLTGATKDFIIVGSDSGRIVILEYDPEKNIFVKYHQETFGKSGCRRLVPGQFLAPDPKGRAVMIGSLEKQKLVYILNRDAAARLTISSPLEAHKANTIVFAICAMHQGFDNPVFACLEYDYEESDADPTGEALENAEQSLTYYELDLGLNHVVRKYSDELPAFANKLIAVPGGTEGPGGLLICFEDTLMYKSYGEPTITLAAPIPTRAQSVGDVERGQLIVASAVHRTKAMTFFLVQTELGDLFKVSLDVTADGVVGDMRIKYLDTVPVATTLCVLKAGFLYVGTEFGNHSFYQITQLGDDDGEPEFSASQVDAQDLSHLEFQPRDLTNLVLVDERESLSPIMASRVHNFLDGDTPQIITACGRGPTSSLRMLKHGIEVTELAVTPLPGVPSGIWTVKLDRSHEYDKYIVVSFTDATVVLMVDETVEQVTDTNINSKVKTLSISLIGQNTLLQIHTDGMRQIRSDTRPIEWKTPAKREIVAFAVNSRQVVIALEGGELMYFEIDNYGNIVESTETKEFPEGIEALALGPVPADAQRSNIVAVSCGDNSLRILSVQPETCLEVIGIQGLPSKAVSLAMVGLPNGTDEVGAEQLMHLNMGLENGVLLRSTIDSRGQISDTRTRYLGSRPVKVVEITLQGERAVAALSSRPWLAYPYQGRSFTTPMSYERLDGAASFNDEKCPEGLVAIVGETLRVVALEKLGHTFNQTSFPLKMTPRALVVHPSKKIITIEGDHRAYTTATKAAKRAEFKSANGDMDTDDVELPEDQFGAPPGEHDQWASCLRLLDIFNVNNESGDATLDVVEYEQNEAVFTLACCEFRNQPNVSHIIVGTATEFKLPRLCKDGFLNVYRVESDNKFALVHRTAIGGVPGAICAFDGRIIVGVDNMLRIYDLGKKKMLKKCETRSIPTFITSLTVAGNRICVGDVQHSIIFVKFRPDTNQLVVYCDDPAPRYITTSLQLDYNTVAAADKFGNITIMRTNQSVNDDIDEDPSGDKVLWQRGYLNASKQKSTVIGQFYVGETVRTMQRTVLVTGGKEVIVYTTISGAIGCLLPFSSRADRDFFQVLELHMRQEMSPLLGRDHLSYRSYYTPVKDIIDGDLCEQYALLELKKRQQIAEESDRTPAEVLKKLEDVRLRSAF